VAVVDALPWRAVFRTSRGSRKPKVAPNARLEGMVGDVCWHGWRNHAHLGGVARAATARLAQRAASACAPASTQFIQRTRTGAFVVRALAISTRPPRSSDPARNDNVWGRSSI